MPAPDTLAAMAAALNDLSIGWGILNEPADLESGLDSDLDVVVDEPAKSVMARVHPELDRQGLHGVMAVQYDLGGWAGWFADEAADHRGQFDFLHDPIGMGRLALPTADMVASVRMVGSLPLVSDSWRVAYRVSKSIGKGQWERLAAVADIPQAGEELAAVFGSGAAAEIEKLESAPPERWQAAGPGMIAARSKERARRLGARGLAIAASRYAQRSVHRVVSPVGFWVHAHGPDAESIAREVDAWAGKTLPRHSVRREASPLGGRVVAPLILRPHLAITWSLRPVRFLVLRPGLVVNDGTSPVGEVMSAMTHATARRVA